MWLGTGTVPALALLAMISFLLMSLPVDAVCDGTEKGFIGGFTCVTDAGTTSGAATDLRVLAITIIKTGLLFVAVIALGAIIWGGIMYIMALGDDKKVGTAKHILLYSIIGLIVTMISAVIVNVVINLF